MLESVESNVELKIKEAIETNYLDLSYLNLIELPEIQESLKNIEYLFINNNNIKTLKISFFQNITVIDLSDNPITEINYLPPNLIELVCNNCKIENMCPHNSIKKIHCINNNLTEIQNYSNLIDLQCGENNLKTIPSLLKLEYLSCYDNPIIKINFLPILKTLNCDNTLLENIIDFAPSLKYLSCCNTKILDISNLKDLNEIELIDSKINTIPFISELKSIIINNMNINISPKYKIKNLFNTGNKINIYME